MGLVDGTKVRPVFGERVVIDYSLGLKHVEILQSMQAYVGENLQFLAPIDKAWQPDDYLPSFTAPDWREQVESFRTQAEQISDRVLVVLVGDMVTEEALPSYAVSLNLIARDDDGDSDKPWAKWLRGWTAEENRHGDLLNAYLRLTGRVDMRAIEITVHHLLASGFNPRANPDPYSGLIYTAFQERATKISHANVGKLVLAEGDEHLSKICQRIAGDESRHEAFYTKMMRHVMEIDPEGGIMAFRNMMRGIIAMPGRHMYDGKDADLFDHFAIVAQRLGVYTVHDYAAITDHLVKIWDVASRSVSGKAAKAQDWLCRQAERYSAYADEVAASLGTQPEVSFSWIHNRLA
jgi:acyl-[acyl-carrier-protein] desaturase